MELLVANSVCFYFHAKVSDSSDQEEANLFYVPILAYLLCPISMSKVRAGALLFPIIDSAIFLECWLWGCVISFKF